MARTSKFELDIFESGSGTIRNLIEKSSKLAWLDLFQDTMWLSEAENEEESKKILYALGVVDDTPTFLTVKVNQVDWDKAEIKKLK